VAEVVELDFATAERRRVAVASVLARAINEGFVAVGIVAEAWMVRRPFNTGERPSECDDRMPGVAVTVYDFGSEARYVSAAPFEEREGVKTFGPLTWVEGRGGEAE
jgi:tetrahydromethanopterin S-methyltransferase subunit C